MIFFKHFLLTMVVTASSISIAEPSSITTDGDNNKIWGNGISGPIDGNQGKKIILRELSISDRALKSNISDSFFTQLDAFVVKQDYDTVFKSLEPLGSDPKIIVWLEKHLNDGHLVLSWALAQKMIDIDPEKAYKYAYLAAISTVQEQFLCKDSENIAYTVFQEKFSKVVRFTRANPFTRNDAMAWVFKFLSEIKVITPPDIWLCDKYKNPAFQVKQSGFKPSDYEIQRKNIRNQLRKKFGVRGSDEV